MPSPLRIAVARPADWPAVARWTFHRDRDREPFAGLRADRLVALFVGGTVAADGGLVATRDGVAVGGLVVQHLPGGTAVVLLPGGESEAVRDALVAAAVGRFTETGIVVAQAFVDRGEEDAAAVLTRHGFRRVTTVSQLSREPGPVAPPVRPAPELRLVPYWDASPEVFAETLVATYRDSLDVPEANTTRTAAQVLAGYRHGQPDPPTWWLAVDTDGCPLGVLLLALDGPAALDVMYLGVVPEWRGRGAGAVLLRSAIERGNSARRSLNLSVDDRNGPAVRLYTAHGFRTRNDQHVFLWTDANSAG